MSNHLTDFLIQLGENPAKLQEFQKNPRRAIAKAHLTSQQRTAVLSRDVLQIRRCLLSLDDPIAPVWVQPIQVVARLRPSV